MLPIKRATFIEDYETLKAVPLSFTECNFFKKSQLFFKRKCLSCNVCIGLLQEIKSLYAGLSL